MATQRWLGWRGVAAVVALFATSRLGWWLAGIRFDASPVDWYWQILDLDLLRDRLAESLWFLHAQPPGFNALIGVAATLGEPGAVLRWVFLGLGALLAVALADALRRLSWSVPEAVAAAVLLANGLPWVVTEHWLFYDFPCTVLLGLCGWALLRIADDWRLGVSVFAGSAAALSLIRSLFHPLWMVMALAMMVWAAPTAARRRAGIVAVAALLLVGGVVVKNGALFGVWGTSSWLGMSLAKLTTARLAPEERTALIRSGVLSPMAGVRPFSPVETYERAVGTTWPDGDVPALARRTRSGGAPNYNHPAYLDISRASRADALTVIRRHPGIYGGAVTGAIGSFLQSPLRYPALGHNLSRVPGAWWLYERTVGQASLTVVLLLLALATCVVAGLRAARSGDRGLAAAAGWLVLNLGWLMVVASGLEIGENNRFRLLITPLVWVVMLEAGRWALSRRRRPTSRPVP
jgi:hypothetical protein